MTGNRFYVRPTFLSLCKTLQSTIGVDDVTKDACLGLVKKGKAQINVSDMFRKYDILHLLVQHCRHVFFHNDLSDLFFSKLNV